MKFDIGIELLRCISMIMIVIIHYFTHGGVFENTYRGSTLYYIIWSVDGLCDISVNCFMLISGYLLSTKAFSAKRIIKLYFEILFYSIIIIIYTQYFTPYTITVKDLILCLPIVSRNNWYVTVYFGISLLIPYFNKFINNIDQKTHTSALISGFILFSMIPTSFFYTDQFNVNKGYSVIWYSYLYFVGAYIHKYNSESKIIFYLNKYKFILLFSVLILPISKFILDFTNLNLYVKNYGYNNLSNILYKYNSIPVLFSSVSLFYIFLNIKIYNTHIYNLIIYFSKSTFGVFYIHTYFLIKRRIWIYLKINNIYNSWLIIPHCIISVSLVFLICTFIDHIRIFIFKKINIDKISNILNDKVLYCVNNKI